MGLHHPHGDFIVNVDSLERRKVTCENTCNLPIQESCKLTARTICYPLRSPPRESRLPLSGKLLPTRQCMPIPSNPLDLHVMYPSCKDRDGLLELLERSYIRSAYLLTQAN